ncbi:hypothetical protein phiPsa267_138 [Pseudomonas phage phiPsa267]|uniref:Uncharacterized protein n=5 Tax=Otagovirus TaxID=2560197 RepID=A0A7G9V0Y7_9CAUD|nr:hypothetical protein CF96_gp087 [Pseudomonas phage phiPsa374]YP_010767228.1 hypothetical protein QGX16_gp087 [Pseudomonas phage phiPsa397]YP_010767398.1 hypothetical protein QGX17_gp089 [Pseudomonas phage phiPsa381]YP_010767573.1 hypothetical protein QGX18_gp091 [Pseudomonas phage phiPsa347]YP_010767748.1 hypothetical protein QGX19_gp092 [Pseudomonas phage phiPsa267]AHJ87393.1 hypothetical protein phiPsa374_133 [Pseudomonas phage phiPsa374]QNN99942.1 hypothetical protein phiPsa267_138 [Pse
MRWISKQFLSPCADETGSMVCQVETPLVKHLYISNYDHMGRGNGERRINPDLDAYVTFRACHGEPVKLDFCAHDQKSFEKRLTKISFMIQELEGMRHQMTEMWYSHLRDIEFKLKEEEKDE